MIISFLSTFFLLLCGHAVGDFALQTEWVATNKNRHVRDKFSSGQLNQMEIIWPWLLTAHALIHAGAVYIVTLRIDLAFFEFVAHCLIDFGKCEKWYGFHIDQILHISCKLLWVTILFYA